MIASVVGAIIIGLAVSGGSLYAGVRLAKLIERKLARPIGQRRRRTMRMRALAIHASLRATPARATTCPYCKVALAEPDAPLRCPTCSTAHHVACWNENGGCTILGCAKNPRRTSMLHRV